MNWVRRAATFAAVAALVAPALCPAAAGAATHAPLPRLAKVGNPSPASLAPGKAFVVRFRAVNRSLRTSPRARFSVRLTRLGKRRGLRGTVAVPALKKGRSHRGSRRVVLSRSITPGNYRVVACLKRRGARTVCGTAARVLRVRAAAPPHEPEPAPPDTTAPVVTIDAPAEGAELTGRKPLVSGTAGIAPGDVRSVTVGFSGAGNPQTVTASVDDSGAWSARPDTDLGGGAWTVAAAQRDDAGNSGTSPARGFEVAAVLLASGDIAGCDTSGDEATAAVLDGLPSDAVAPLGDLVYEEGTLQQFDDCYDPTWGRHKARSRPAIGNHEYETPGAAGYFGYFGAVAGDPTQGYYSFDVGRWHVVVLNSNCPDQVACDAVSPQADWLRADLAAHPAQCTAAYWHHPLFHSSPETAPRLSMRPLWEILDDAGVDLALTGHAHVYERFAPQDAAGVASPTGLREFVVGVGGRGLHAFSPTIAANSEAHQNTEFGVLELTLRRAGYDWRFVPVAGGTFTDSGSADCV